MIWTKLKNMDKSWIIWTKVGQYGQKLESVDKIGWTKVG